MHLRDFYSCGATRELKTVYSYVIHHYIILLETSNQSLLQLTQEPKVILGTLTDDPVHFGFIPYLFAGFWIPPSPYQRRVINSTATELLVYLIIGLGILYAIYLLAFLDIVIVQWKKNLDL